MKRGAVLFLYFLLPALFAVSLALVPSMADAALTETPVACKEGVIREPILLKYGEHTDGCQLEYVSDIDQFSFYGKIGDVVTFSVGWTTDSYRRTLSIRVLNPSGTTAFHESTAIVRYYYGDYWRKSISLTETGTHFILIEENEHDATAGYQVAIEGIPPMISPPRLNNASPQQGVIEGPADIDLYAFQGSAGSLVRIPVSFTSSSYYKNMHVEIRDSEGLKLVSQDSGIVNYYYATNVVIEFTVTENGRYYVAIDGEGTTFDYEVLLQCISGACPNLQPQPSVEGCLLEQGQPLAGVKVKLEQAGEPKRYKVTDSRGCYSFTSVVADLEYRVSVAGTVE
jgi:hypothetical protein